MANVYSTRFALVTNTPAFFSIAYTVPAGFVWVVRTCTAMNATRTVGTGANGFHFFVSNTGGISAEFFGKWPPYATFDYTHVFEGWVVLNPGEQLQIQTNDAGWQFTASGHQLTLP